MFLGDMKAVYVVESTIVRFRNDGQAPGMARKGRVLKPSFVHPGDNGVPHHADTVGVGDHNRAGQEP